MVNLTLLATKLAELAARVARVRTHRKSDAEALGADRDALDLVSFNLRRWRPYAHQASAFAASKKRTASPDLEPPLPRVVIAEHE